MDGTRMRMSNEVWDRISKALYAVKHPAGSPPALSDRDFVDAILYVARTGIPWRDLPERFGDWNAVYQRFRRWQKAGYWQAIFLIVPGDLADAHTAGYLSRPIHPHKISTFMETEGLTPILRYSMRSRPRGSSFRRRRNQA